MLTVENKCAYLELSSELLENYTALSPSELELTVKYDCNTVLSKLQINFLDITEGKFRITGDLLNQGDKINDGVYSITLSEVEPDSSYYEEYACIFADCVTKCKVVEKTEAIRSQYNIKSWTDFNLITDPVVKKAVFDVMLMVQYMTALSYLNVCTSCTCDNGCVIWCELQRLLGINSCDVC
jgi:hypothetical protein